MPMSIMMLMMESVLCLYVFIYLFIHRQCPKFVKGRNIAVQSCCFAHSLHKATIRWTDSQIS